MDPSQQKKIATFVPCVFLVFHYFSYRVIGIKLKSEKKSVETGVYNV